MTQEELLANIKEQEYAYDNLANALRAVVELHKPLKGTVTCHQYCDTEDYPCDTIQAIEKELM